MSNKGMMNLPIKEGNLMIAKAEALDLLIDRGVVDKNYVLNIDDEAWCCEYLQKNWK